MNRYFTLLFLIITTVFMSVSVQAQGNLLNNKDLVKIYPHPLVSQSTIQLDSRIDYLNNQVSIHFYNMIGSEVYFKENIKESEIIIDKQHFKNGVYLYQLRSNGATLSTGKMSVN
jgi:hypothetical protein